MNNQLQYVMESRKRGRPSYRQTPIGFGLLILALIMMSVFYYYQRLFFYYGSIGLILGYILRRGKFCFVAGMRDPYLIGTTTLLRSILLSIMISTAGYSFVEAIQQGSLWNLVVPAYIDGVNFLTAIGGLLFGIGMVLAGGCATGMIVRIGEGYKAQILVLIGFIIGATLAGMWDGLWKLFKDHEYLIYFPTYMSLPVALVLQEGLLILLYILAGRHEKKIFNG